MNKSLETEYKEQVRIDLPDLWGKIEEKLDAQTVQTNVTEFPKTVASAQNVQIENQINKTEKKEKLEKIFADEPKAEIRKDNVVPVKKKRNIPWHYFGLAAAAVLCMLVVIPAMSNMRGASTTMENAPSASVQTAGNSTGATAMDAASEGAGDCVASEEMAEPTESVEEAEETFSYTDDVTEDLAEVPQNETDKRETAGNSATDNTDSMIQTTEAESVSGESEDADGVPAAAPGGMVKDTGKCDILVLMKVSEGTTEEQLSQLVKDLKKSVDPDFSITMISKEEAAYTDYIDPQNDRAASHLIVLNGARTDDQILEQIEFLWLKLKDYDYVKVCDIQHRELNYDD